MIVTGYSRARLVEWLLAGLAFSWGTILLMPAQTFALPSFDGLARVGSELEWAVAFFVLGSGRLIVLYVNGKYRRTAHLRMVAAGFSAFAWFSISAAFWSALWSTGIVSPGLMTNPLLCTFDLYIVLLAARDARETDELCAAMEQLDLSGLPEFWRSIIGGIIVVTMAVVGYFKLFPALPRTSSRDGYDANHFRKDMVAVVDALRGEIQRAQAGVKEARDDQSRVRAEYALLHAALHKVTREAVDRETILQQKISDIVTLAAEQDSECKRQLADLTARLERHEKTCRPTRKRKS